MTFQQKITFRFFISGYLGFLLYFPFLQIVLNWNMSDELKVKFLFPYWFWCFLIYPCFFVESYFDCGLQEYTTHRLRIKYINKLKRCFKK